MAIVKMSKFNLIVFEAQKSKILKKLQKFKEVDFIDIELKDGENLTTISNVDNTEELLEVEEELNLVDNSLKLLKKYYVGNTGIKGLIEGNKNYTYDELTEKVTKEYNWKETVFKLKELGNKYIEVKREISKRYDEIEKLQLWNNLDVTVNNLKKLKYVNYHLGYVPMKLKHLFLEKMSTLDFSFFKELKITKDEIRYLIFSYNNEMESDKLNEILKETSFTLENISENIIPKEQINILRNEIENLKSEKEKLKESIKVFEVEIKDLEAVYEYLRNKKLRIETTEKIVKTKNICSISGWIPTAKTIIFEEIIKEVVGEEYYLFVEKARKDDETVPIKLNNGVVAKSFESLTGMYAYPKYNEIDPTPFIVPFYIIFFGMMGADVGYGAVLMVATYLALKIFNLNEKTKLFVKFFFYLSFSVIIWGILYGSYFGMTIPGVWKLINPATEYNKLLIGSVLFGIVHIYFGLGLKAYLLFKEGKSLDILYDVVFWYMALSGGILYLTLKILALGEGVMTVSGIISLIGMVGIIFTGGREAKSIGGKVGGGLYSLYGISGYVGDFVSYSRLMALGLSGGFIAQAINMIIGMVSGSAVGLVFAPIIFLIGHLFNMFLAFLGGYVHTSRLMYVEFFGKFYEGGGKPFKDFCVESKFINLKD